jgi:hypothetical protein
VLPKMAKSLESLYTSPRWLLRRWRWRLGLLSIHVITSKFSEILGGTSYVFSHSFLLPLKCRNLDYMKESDLS